MKREAGDFYWDDLTLLDDCGNPSVFGWDLCDKRLDGSKLKVILTLRKRCLPSLSIVLEGPAGTSRPQVFCSVPTRLTYPNLILAATVADLAKSAPSRATEHHKFEP